VSYHRTQTDAVSHLLMLCVHVTQTMKAARRLTQRCARAGAGSTGSWADSGPTYTNVQRNLALELVRVTEAAALASGKWFGKVGRCLVA